MIERRVKDVVTPQAASDGAGVRLRRSIATQQLDHLDPFFLFDHFGSEDPGDYIAGFPMHPHRGIETVTYMLDGSVAHRDSLGNAGVIGAGRCASTPVISRGRYPGRTSCSLSQARIMPTLAARW